MSKIIQTEEEPDFSEENVNKKVKELFGDNAKIDKTKVSTPDIAKSLYYYSEEADSYSVIPVGIEGIFEYQILKNVTETDEAYFVYELLMLLNEFQKTLLLFIHCFFVFLFTPH